MMDNETKNPVSTSLSAEAKSFIPSHLKEANGGPENNGQVLNQGLPKYMTNCYPFVQTETPHRPSLPGGHSNGSWQQPRSNLHSNLQRNHFSNGHYNSHQPGVRMPGVQSFNPRLPRPQTYQGSMAPAHQSSPLISPLQMQCPPPPLLSPPQSAMPNFMPHNYQFPRGPPSPHNWMSPPPPHMQYSPEASQYAQVPYPSTDGLPHTQAGKPHGERNKNKKKRGEWSNMVSVGIQNETGTQSQMAPGYSNAPVGSKKKNKPKTIMCMDAAIQTDFSDELANKTLLEKPSTFYESNRVRNRHRLYQDSTTDSEVDSDSGYSSPMHRRNQASSGTHPLTATGAYLAPPPPPGAAYPPLSAVCMPPPPVFSGYAQAVAGFGAAPPPFRQPQPMGHVPGYNNMPCAPAAVRPHSRRIQADTKSLPPHHVNSIGQTANVMQKDVSPVKQGYSAALSSNPPSKPKQKSSNSDINLQPKQSTKGASNKQTAEQTTKSPSRILSIQNSTRSNRAKTEGEEEDEVSSTSSKTKRKRSRRRRRKTDGSPERQGAFSDGQCDLVRAHSSSNVSRTSTVENEILHFEDEDEFPNLLTAVGGLQGDASQPLAPASYCDILKGQVGVSHLSQDSAHSFSSGGFKSSPELSSLKGAKETKNSRKKRKRREAIDEAAQAELAEITLEQQVLRELSAKSQSEQHKKPGGGGGKRSSQPISLNIADMISALEKQQDKEQNVLRSKASVAPFKKPQNSFKDTPKVANMLDANAPVKRGKEREIAKPKKPSPLKKVILKEREERKRLRLLEDGVEVTADAGEGEAVPQEDEQDEEELSPDGAGKGATLEMNADASAELSPISQTSPISMSPLSGSPLNSGFNSPVAQQGALSSLSVISRIHSRRFREYCTQVLDKDIDQCCMVLLQELVRFQDRLYHKDPTKAKSKRRIVLGLREVTKHLKMNKIKCVIISPNLERIQSKGGLDEALNNIILIAQEQTVPVVFALGRRALGRACAKLVPVSVVGIFNYEGCDEYFKRLMDMTKKARDAYTEMVTAMEKELEQRTTAAQPPAISTIADMPKFFSHMGHSRTPSGCSGISLTSSILSEPISENYPYSEPETDSRGYEIVRGIRVDPSKAVDEGTGETLEEKLQKIESDLREIEEQERNKSPHTDSEGGKVCIVESLCEIDEGNEADTEDDVVKRVTQGDTSNKSKVASDGTSGISEGITHKVLPPFDSIHTTGGADTTNTDKPVLEGSTVIPGMKAEAQSSEVMSTHSSKTLEAGRCTPDRLSSGSSTHKVKAMDNDRIEEWVAKTQKQVEMLSMTEETEEEEEQQVDGATQNLVALGGHVGDHVEVSDIEDGLSERISMQASSENDEIPEDETSFHDCEETITTS